MTDLFDRKRFINVFIDIDDDFIQQFIFKTLLHRCRGNRRAGKEIILEQLDDQFFQITKHQLIVIEGLIAGNLDKIVQCVVDVAMRVEYTVRDALRVRKVHLEKNR